MSIIKLLCIVTKQNDKNEHRTNLVIQLNSE